MPTIRLDRVSKIFKGPNKSPKRYETLSGVSLEVEQG